MWRFTHQLSYKRLLSVGISKKGRLVKNKKNVCCLKAMVKHNPLSDKYFMDDSWYKRQNKFLEGLDSAKWF